MTLGNRIKKIRKELDLTQTEFAEKIGSVQNTVTGYESGRRNPSSPVIALICERFNVREEWLRTGEGEMFQPKSSNVLDQLAREYQLSRADYILIEKFISLRPEARKAVFDYLHEIDAALSSEDMNPHIPASIQNEKSVEELEAEYKKNVLHSAASTDSTISSTIGDIERKASSH